MPIEMGLEEIRVGIGSPIGDQANYVLSKWSSEQSKTINEIFEKGCDAVETILSQGIIAAMNTFNIRN